MHLLGSKMKMVHETKVIAGGGVEAIRIQANPADINVSVGTGDDIHVLLEGKISESIANKLEFSVQQNGGILDIDIIKHQGKFFGVMATNLSLHVTVPPKIYDDFHVTSSSGDCVVNNIETKSYTGIASSGNHIAARLRVTGRLMLKASSGDMLVKNCHADSVMAWVSSGSVHIRDLTSKQAKYEASSGEIVLHTDQLEGSTECKVSSGNIRIRGKSFSGDLDCRATSGNVNIDSDAYPENLRVDCRVTSGSRKVRIGGLTATEKQKNSFSGVRGDAKANSICAVTTSGNISIMD
ncbi:DUF4097 family beta strand repeat-containing protein [Virgibacillus siamensis]|uniref:DUF4097 family beta strand repeat-containing protein n=1 Tax=Virgibacillus siamensis TaxID=480071 RepID=UPI0009876B49|nr:DUF4097 family beta strand repeat-containing protein [Virgibacillus siamensis]